MAEHNTSINLHGVTLGPTYQINELPTEGKFISFNLTPQCGIILPGFGAEAAKCAADLALMLMRAAAEVTLPSVPEAK